MEKAKAQVRERVGGMIEQLSAIKEEDEGSRRNTWFRLNIRVYRITYGQPPNPEKDLLHTLRER